MSLLRVRILWRVLALGLLALLFAVQILQQTVDHSMKDMEFKVLEGFERIEYDNALKDIYRAEDAITSLVDHLAIKEIDWSNWDDTWNYVVTPSKHYEKANLGVDPLTGLKINYMVFANAKGQLIKKIAVNHHQGDTATFPESLQQMLLPGGPLLLKEGDSRRKGFVQTPEGLLAIAVSPILPTGGHGEFHGTLLFAKYLDSIEVKLLSDMIHMQLELLPVETSMKELPMKVGDRIITPLDSQWLEGKSLQLDLFGQPAYVIRVVLPRDIYQQSIVTVNDVHSEFNHMSAWLVYTVVIFVLALYLVLGVVLELLVLRRLTRISKDAVDAGERGEYSVRLVDVGRVSKNPKYCDEITRTADAVNLMLQALQKGHEDLERKDAALRLLFDSVPVGLLSLDENFCVEAGASLKAMELLGNQVQLQTQHDGVFVMPVIEEINGRRLAQILHMNAEENRRLEDYLDVYRLGLMDDMDMEGLNPFPEWKLVHNTGKEIWLRLSYRPIRSYEANDRAKRILVIMQECTEERRQLDELVHLRSEVGLLRAFLEDPEAVRQFLEEAQATVKEMRRTAWLVQGQSNQVDHQDVAQMFRWVHTLHGSAATLGLEQVAHASYRLESALSAIRDGVALIPIRGESGMSSIPEVEAKDSLELLEKALQLAEQMAKDLVGDVSDQGMELRVLSQDIEDIVSLMEPEALQQGSGGPLSMAVFRLQSLRQVPIGRAFARLVRATPGFAADQGKKAALHLRGDGVGMDPELSTALAGVVIHLLRNSIAHGIESPDERHDAGKPEEGRIDLVLSRDSQGILIQFSDDGRGIHQDRVLEVARERGISYQDQSDQNAMLLDILCSPGFTTRESADHLSGRGVGLDSVREQILYLGGTLTMSTIQGAGTTFKIHLPRHLVHLHHD